MTLKDQLRAALKDVTPEPWSLEKEDATNMAYIALCSPGNITALLNHIDALEVRLAEAEEVIRPFAALADSPELPEE